MKTIVLFFVLFMALTAVTAGRNKHKAKDSSNDGLDDSNDWPNAESVGEFGVPPEYGGPPPNDDDNSDPTGTHPGGNPSSGRSHSRSNRRH